jgi:alkylation response protein AidB-like acyl-CoA dehydrogenase
MTDSYVDTWTQELPHISNPFLSDTTLLDILKTRLSDEIFNDIQKSFTEFGNRCITEVKTMGEHSENNLPKLYNFDAWQRRIDEIETSFGWKRLNHISAEEGLISLGYQRKPSKQNPKGYGRYARLVQFAKLYLFDSNADIFDCPLAMTDGAARLIEATLHHNRELPENVRQALKDAFEHLTSTDPAQFWTSGQWMTEKRGGSDVSQATRTIAIPSPNPTPSSDHVLRGVKFFTSATDANMTFTLGRIVKSPSDLNNLEKIPLSLFFLRIRDDKGNLNNIQVHKLKNKLGTKAVPTAELTLNNTKALLIGKQGRGISGISYMLNITRTWNSMGACSYMRRLMALAQDYATRRTAFGKRLVDLPLHARTLARLEAETRGCTHFTFDITERLGKLEWDELEENKSGEDANSLMLRLLVPIVKLYTARQGVSVITEGIECLGGQGYMEDSGIPAILRNAHVLPIWEGTTNVLSVDVLRVLRKHGNALEVFGSEVAVMLANKTKRVASLSAADEKYLKFSVNAISSALKQLQTRLRGMYSKGNEEAWKLLELSVRDLAFSLAQIYVAALLFNHVMNNRSTKTSVSLDIQTLYQYVITHEPLCKFLVYEEGSPVDILHAEKMVATDIGGSGAEGKGVNEIVFTPFTIKSTL